jgi:carbonic anhydrase/acetyltransferase-like protein (isoleucine patch superfamily)
MTPAESSSSRAGPTSRFEDRPYSVKLRYLHHESALGESAVIVDTAAVIGRMAAGSELTLRAFATLRADGEHIRVGHDVYFGEHSTSHIVDSRLGTTVGDHVTVGRYGVVHGCTLADRVVVGEGAAILDEASVGAGAVIAADSIVSPGKKLRGGWLHEGVPAKPVREISSNEVDAIARSIRQGEVLAPVRSTGLPPMRWPRHARSSHRDALRSPSSYVAPTAVLTGNVELREDAGIYFGCVVDASDGRVVVGERSNVQDNSFLLTSRACGDLVIGAGVTIGHNVQMGSGSFGDDCLVGIMSRVADDVMVEPGGCIAAGAWVEAGTVVKAGWIWAGRPARPFRELKPAERKEFARGRDVYVAYGAAYRGSSRGRSSHND